MNWKDLARDVAGVAPAIGGVLAGPAGAAAGSLLASVLGTKDDAAAVDQAITADPKALTKIKQAELTHATEMRKLLLTAQTQALAEQTQQLQSVNTTMRAELATSGLFKSGWRSAVGWVMAVSFAATTLALCWAVIVDPSQLANAISGVMTLVIAMAAVLGVNIHKISQERQTALTGVAPAGLLGALTGKAAPQPAAGLQK